MPEAPVATKTTYVVLQGVKSGPILPGLKDDDESVDVTSFSPVQNWKELGRVEADSAEAAIRQIADGTTKQFEGYAVAIPSRSWKPVKVSVETVSRVKLEDA